MYARKHRMRKHHRGRHQLIIGIIARDRASMLSIAAASLGNRRAERRHQRGRQNKRQRRRILASNRHREASVNKLAAC